MRNELDRRVDEGIDVLALQVERGVPVGRFDFENQQRVRVAEGDLGDIDLGDIERGGGDFPRIQREEGPLHLNGQPRTREAPTAFSATLTGKKYMVDALPPESRPCALLPAMTEPPESPDAE